MALNTSKRNHLMPLHFKGLQIYSMLCTKLWSSVLTQCVRDSSSVYCMHSDDKRHESSHHDHTSQETDLQHTVSTHSQHPAIFCSVSFGVARPLSRIFQKNPAGWTIFSADIRLSWILRKLWNSAENTPERHKFGQQDRQIQNISSTTKEFEVLTHAH